MQYYTTAFYLADYKFFLKTNSENIYLSLREYLITDSDKPLIDSTIFIIENINNYQMYSHKTDIKITIPKSKILNVEDLFFVLKFYIQKYTTTFPYIFLHASAVIQSGKAFIFLGESESGKSTISRTSGLEILSDDIVVLGKKNNIFFAGGSNLDLKLSHYDPKVYPISTIYTLKKTLHTYYQKMPLIERIAAIFSSTILSEGEIEEKKIIFKKSNWSKDRKNYSIKMLLDVIEKIPILRLGFTKEYLFKTKL